MGFSLALAAALGYLPYRIYRNSGLHRYVELSDELRQMKAHNAQLRDEARRLRAELDAFGRGGDAHGDKLPLAVVERAARDELGLVRPGELVFQVVPQVGPQVGPQIVPPVGSKVQP